MKVIVKLYGTLRERFSDYRDEQGMEINIPDESRVQDLLGHLQIPESLGAVVTVDGRIMKLGDKVQGGTDIRIFQAIHGG